MLDQFDPTAWNATAHNVCGGNHHDNVAHDNNNDADDNVGNDHDEFAYRNSPTLL